MHLYSLYTKWLLKKLKPNNTRYEQKYGSLPLLFTGSSLMYCRAYTHFGTEQFVNWRKLKTSLYSLTNQHNGVHTDVKLRVNHQIDILTATFLEDFMRSKNYICTQQCKVKLTFMVIVCLQNLFRLVNHFSP